MTTLIIGIASVADYKARTLAIARGELKASTQGPKVWFTSIESVAKPSRAVERSKLQEAKFRNTPNSKANSVSGRYIGRSSRT